MKLKVFTRLTLPVSLSLCVCVSLLLRLSAHCGRHRSKLLASRLRQLLLLQHESRSHEETPPQHLLLQVHARTHTHTRTHTPPGVSESVSECGRFEPVDEK